jgi:hypothetical protein
MSDHVVLTDQNSIRCNHCGVNQGLPNSSSINVWSAIGKAFDKDHRDCEAPTVPVCLFCRAVDHSSDNHVKVTCKQPWQWPSCADTGLSSRALFAHFTKGRAHEADAPSDPSDFGRCYRLLNADFAEGWAERIDEMAVYPQWAPLVPHWSEITRLYEEEKDLDSAPKTYAFMMKIRRETR